MLQLFLTFVMAFNTYSIAIHEPSYFLSVKYYESNLLQRAKQSNDTSNQIAMPTKSIDKKILKNTSKKNLFEIVRRHISILWKRIYQSKGNGNVLVKKITEKKGELDKTGKTINQLQENIQLIRKMNKLARKDYVNIYGKNSVFKLIVEENRKYLEKLEENISSIDNEINVTLAKRGIKNFPPHTLSTEKDESLSLLQINASPVFSDDGKALPTHNMMTPDTNTPDRSILDTLKETRL